MSEHLVDARNLFCPLPVIRTQQKIDQLADGDTLRVVATDPGAQHDIAAWCRVHGHRLLHCPQDESEREYHFVIRICKS